MKILGYRVWTTLPGLLTLRSHHATYTWKPGENVATYKGDEWAGTSGHTGPIPCTSYSCPCGFWAYDTPENALNGSQASHKNVLGIVLGYGRVLLAETGWRAEKSRIIGIAHGWRTDLAKFAEHYQVPLVAMDKLEWLIEEHGGIAMADVPEDWTVETEVSVRRNDSYSWASSLGGYGFVPMSVSMAAMVRELLYGTAPRSYVKGVGVSFTTGQPITYDIDCSCGYRTKCASMLPQPTIDIMCVGCQQKLTFQPNNQGTWQQPLPATPSTVNNNAPVSPYSLAQEKAKAVKKKVTTHRNTKLLSLPSPVNGASRVVSIAECKNDSVDYITDEVLCSCGGTAYRARQKHLPFVSFAGFCPKCHQKLTATAADLLALPKAKMAVSKELDPLIVTLKADSKWPKFDFNMRSHGGGKMQGFDITSAWIDDAATGKFIKGDIS